MGLMRALFVLLVIVALSYLGWVIFREASNPEEPSLPLGKAAEAKPASVAANATPSAPVVAAAADLAPPGVFYTIERVSVETATGVKALIPGEEVKLMYRYKDGRMLVTNGSDEFVVNASALTQDRRKLHPLDAPLK